MAQPTLSHQTMYQFHQEKLKNGIKLSDNTDELVEMLGGIDKIIADYLSVKQLQSSISATNLQQIHQILSTPKSNREINTSKKNNVYNFDEMDTFLHSLFMKETADKLYHIASTKKLIIFMVTISLMFYIWFIIYPNNHIRIYTDIILTIICKIPCLVLWLLTVNRVATKLIIIRFEFLLKVYFILVWFISGNLYVGLIADVEDRTLILCSKAVNMPVWFMAVVIIFLFDGYNINKIMKIGMASLLTIFFFWSWIERALFRYENGESDPSVIKVYNNIYISLYETQEKAYFILWIFCLKQAFLIWYNNKGKQENKKAVLIKITPRIRWNQSIHVGSSVKDDSIQMKIQKKMKDKSPDQVQNTQMSPAYVDDKSNHVLLFS